MSIVRLDLYKQKQHRAYMKRYRSRIDLFIKAHIPIDASGDILRFAELYHRSSAARPELVWDYVEMRETMIDFISAQVASEIYEELQKQFWFDERFVTKDMVAERCLTFMILGSAAMAAE